MQKVLMSLIEPYRKADQDEVLECLSAKAAWNAAVWPSTAKATSATTANGTTRRPEGPLLSGISGANRTFTFGSMSRTIRGFSLMRRVESRALTYEPTRVTTSGGLDARREPLRGILRCSQETRATAPAELYITAADFGGHQARRSWAKDLPASRHSQPIPPESSDK